MIIPIPLASGGCRGGGTEQETAASSDRIGKHAVLALTSLKFLFVREQGTIFGLLHMVNALPDPIVKIFRNKSCWTANLPCHESSPPMMHPSIWRTVSNSALALLRLLFWWAHTRLRTRLWRGR